MFAWLKRRSVAGPAARPARVPVDPGDEGLDTAARALRSGDAATCEQTCRRVLAEAPDHGRALALLGMALVARGSVDEGRAALERAVDLAPDLVEGNLALGRLLKSRHELAAARDHLELAVHYAPESADAAFELGSTHVLAGRPVDAERVLRHALDLDPDHVESIIEMVALLGEQNRFQEALPLAERGAALRPESVEAVNALRYVLFQLERWDEALPLAERIVAQTADSNIFQRLDLGNCYLHLGRFEEAAAMFDHVLKYEPNNFEARWNRAHYRLASGLFAEGWVDYRHRHHSLLDTLRALPFPEWRNEPLEGKTLLVYREQGLGDEIMFASCYADVIARARRVVIEAEPRLHALLERSFPGATVVPMSPSHDPDWLRAAGPIDYQAAAGDLPAFLRNAWDDFPHHAGYLRPDPGRVRKWRDRLDSLGPGLKVGISWRGGTRQTRTSARSIPPERWLPILTRPGARFVSLQYGKVDQDIRDFADRTGLHVPHWQEAIDDYDETAALVCALDVVISVCTSLIHLTGALGRPAWVMVPAVPEWRYLRRGEALPWYPSVRLFRQAELGNWNPVVDRVGELLERSVAGGRIESR